MNRRRRKKLSGRLVDAILVGEAAQVRALLRSGAPAETADSAGTTPLYQAAVNGAADLVRVLLAAGARPDTESGTGSEGTPLCVAAAVVAGHVRRTSPGARPPRGGVRGPRGRTRF
ncbi:ankyrin repeat domain-containing protein [Streptomyces sp. NPDC058534]|uniref:ankyrin repeat domain-containing protein n=1 Tax=Streptomyces sp. NPDC058534 TaxID=3346541 RepID=UPI0036502FC1